MSKRRDIRVPTADLVVALGKNWRQAPRLSIESEMVALAAGHLLSTGATRRVLFSGGKTAGVDLPAEATVMAEYMLRRFRGRLTPDHFALEEQSRDTSENAEIVRDYLGHAKYAAVGLLTTASHLPAARQIFAAYAIPVASAYAAENVLIARSTRYASVVLAYHRSPLHRWHVVLEWMRRFILLSDRKGRSMRAITRLTRGRRG